MLVSKNGSAQRLVFYSDENFNEEELVLIKRFKDFCKSNGHKIPATDPEILRFLYSKKKDPKNAYLASQDFLAYQIQNFPRIVNQRIFELLNQGFMYVAGRDRFYRPIVVVNGYMINTLDPQPTEDDLITCALFLINWMKVNCSLLGHVENSLMIINMNGEGVT